MLFNGFWDAGAKGIFNGTVTFESGIEFGIELMICGL
jgi:hypothetical protein